MRTRTWLLVGLAGCRQLAGLDDLPAAPDAATRSLAPSNGVGAAPETAALPAIQISDIATFDTDTGQITGALTRAAGEGVIGNVAYRHATFGGTELGVFAMSRLDVAPAGLIRLQGARAAVLLVETDAAIDGIIDGSGGCADPMLRGCAGPGGGAGGTIKVPATGCSPGQPGTSNSSSGADSGGGGGGAGFAGGAGGDAIVGMTLYQGGTAAPRCMTSELEPLLGGGGGGGGGKGAAPQIPSGGGGGGALQLTAFGSIVVAGKITTAGAGGEGGARDPAANNGGGGGGGGGGGSILLESPSLTITGTLAANGGGGGGASSVAAAGQLGQTGLAKATAAMGGAGAGGAGGALDLPAQAGASMTNGNAGGGGGGAGRIFVRASSPVMTGSTISPAPGIGPIRN